MLLTVPPPNELGLEISSFDRLTSWVLRFCLHARRKQKHQQSLSLTLSELRSSKQVLLVHSQRLTYPSERSLLMDGDPLPKHHYLSCLSPYIDHDGLMRVGRRLQKASLSAAQAHPIILNTKSHVVKLLVSQTHCLLLHAGPSTVMATLCSACYIPRLKPLLRCISQQCVTCQRAYARTSTQLMGELPAVRTRPA